MKALTEQLLREPFLPSLRFGARYFTGPGLLLGKNMSDLFLFAKSKVRKAGSLVRTGSGGNGNNLSLYISI